MMTPFCMHFMTASSMLYMQELLNKYAVWVQAVKKATPPLIHPQFNEHSDSDSEMFFKQECLHQLHISWSSVHACIH